jgi:poly(hydroxyalkanoate) depolymerase family esterase
MGVRDFLRRALAAARRRGHTAFSTLRDAKAVSRELGERGRDSSSGVPRAGPGDFVSRSYTNSYGTRAYKLYVPRNYVGKSVPLIVMLHGCTQNPDDFAAGTRMNELADQHGFLVVYPAQSASANGMKCWNWFHRKDQARDRGEPSLIAGITHEVMSDYPVDEQKVFVAGISAGAAMAVIMATVYPDLFAAVGVHSGVAYGAAHNATSAFAALQGRSKSISATPGSIGRRAERRSAATRSIPTIVFHGDKDATVNPRNGSDVANQAASLAAAADGPLQKTVQKRTTGNGREYTVTIYRTPTRRPVIEQWELHGAGHAWSGGSPTGSYTDETGPDASAEMVRFFLSQRKNA